MKKALMLVMAAIAVMTTLILQGCNNNEENQAAVQAAQEAAEASQQAAEAAQQAAEALQAAVPMQPTRVSGETVGWGSLTPSERAEIIAIGKDHPYGGVIRPEPPIKEVTFILYLEDVPSATPKQALIEYTYETSNGEGSNRILIQGHFESVQNVASIPDVLNNNSCCIFYGGCIKEYECNTPLPKAEKCSPCEQKKPKKEECVPCNAYGSSARQGDGVSPTKTANGSDRILPPVDL